MKKEEVIKMANNQIRKMEKIIKEGMEAVSQIQKILDDGYEKDGTPLSEESRKLYKACSASILNESDVVYVARIPSQHQILSVNLSIGSRLPAYCTSMGRVLLGNLSEDELDLHLSEAELLSHTKHTITDIPTLREIIVQARIQGYCIVNQELEESLCSVAVPVHNRQGKVLCAINVGMSVGQLKIGDVTKEYLPVLKEAASRAESILAHH